MATWLSLFDGQVASSFTAVYTATGQVAVTYFSITNTDSLPHTVTVRIKRSGGTARQIAVVALASGGTVNICDDPMGIRLSSGDIIDAMDGAGSLLDYVGLGVTP